MSRKSPAPSNTSTDYDDGDDVAQGINNQIERLWKSTVGFLQSVAGTNTITCNAQDEALETYAGMLQGTLVPVNTNTGACTINIDGLGAKSLLNSAGGALSANDLIAGRAYHIVYDGTAFRVLTPLGTAALSISKAMFKYSRSAGVDGSSPSRDAWVTYPLNGTIVNDITSAVLEADGSITLPSGTYVIDFSTLFYARSAKVKWRLYNVTDGVAITSAAVLADSARQTVALDAASGGFPWSTVGNVTYSFPIARGVNGDAALFARNHRFGGKVKFTITATKNIALQGYFNVDFDQKMLLIASNISVIDGANRTYSYGKAANIASQEEVYGIVDIQKLQAVDDFSRIYYTDGAPTAGTGTNNDVAIDYTNKRFYEKVSGTWTLRFTITDGNDGWSPVTAIVSHGNRQVVKVTDWTGGGGTKPDVDVYIGASGFVTDIADAVAINSDHVGFAFNFDTSTTMGDPDTGKLRLNNATIASVTSIAIDDTSIATGNPDTSEWVNFINSIDNPTKGIMYLQKAFHPEVFIAFEVTGIVDNIGWTQIDGSVIDSAGTLALNDELILQFSPSGQRGYRSADAGILFSFDTDTTAADPGTGKLRFDNATPNLATSVIVDNLSSFPGNPDVSAWLATFDDSTNTVKGHLIVASQSEPGEFIIMQVSSIVDNSGWYQINGTVVSGSMTPAASDDLVLFFSRSGDSSSDAGVAAILGADSGFQALVAAAAGGNQQLVTGEGVESKTYVPGGLKRLTGPTNTGALRIKLPLVVTDTGQFVMFWVDCYNYSPQASCSFLISAYIYNDGTPQWVSPTVRQIGGAVRHPVVFGNDGANRCIQIGDLTYAWGYPIFRVRDISGNTGAKWTTLTTTPWVLSVETAALASVFVTVYDGRDNGGPDVNGAALDAVTDANSHIKWGGFFNKLLTTGAANIPAPATWAIEYQRQTDLFGTQVAWPSYGNTLAPAIRRNNNGAWGAWMSLAWADDYVPKTGGAFTGALTGTSGSFSTTLGVTGAATLSSTLGVTGAVTFGSTLAVTGATTLSSTLAVAGTLTRAGNTVRDVSNTPDGTQALAQGGSDTSQRTWKATDLKDAAVRWGKVLTDWVNVVNFGATGNGTTDDTAAIQAAINSISSGVVYIPAGSYLVDSLTLLEKVAVWGSTDGASILLARSNSINVLTMSATSATKTHVDIRNLKILGNSKTSVTAIYLNGVSSSNRISYVRIYDVFVSACNEGLHLYYCANTFINNCFVTGTPFGIHLEVCADTNVMDTEVQNGSNAGFYVVGGAGAYDEGVRLTGCSTNGQHIGLWVTGQDWGIADGCSFTTAPGGAALFTGTCANWRLTNSDFAVAGTTPAAAGIDIGSSCSDFVISGNEIALNTFGINCAGTRINISNNNVKANSNVDIYLNGATKCTVNGNNCDSTGAAWSILEAGAANYNAMIGNVTNGTITTTGAQSIAPAGSNVVY
jgi:hypothetical protein